jgi:hypothetical protein
MSSSLLTILVGVPTGAVVVAMFIVMWSARTSFATSRAALVGGMALAVWALAVTVLGLQGRFVQPDGNAVPPVGIALGIAFLVLAVAFGTSPSLRSLFTNQRHLIRLNLWRLEGAVFLLLMFNGQMPALWALPAGIGDIAIGATSFWVADRLNMPGGKQIAIAFNLFGLADLIVAIGLGMTTNVGPLHLFRTVPSSELVTHFPLVLVPTFLVPLAFTLHIVSLTQLVRRPWGRPIVTS